MMIDIETAKAKTLVETIDLVGMEYMKPRAKSLCVSFPANQDEIDYEVFLGIEGDSKSNKWLVFTRINVNRETLAVTMLD